MPDSPPNNQGDSPADNNPEARSPENPAANPANNNNNNSNNGEGGSNPTAATAASYDPFDAEFASIKRTLAASGISQERLIGMASQMMHSLGPGTQQLFTQQYERSKTRLSALHDENAALKKRLATKEGELEQMRAVVKGLLAQMHTLLEEKAEGDREDPQRAAAGEEGVRAVGAEERLEGLRLGGGDAAAERAG